MDQMEEKKPSVRAALPLLYKPLLWSAVYVAAAGLLCLLFIRLLPKIGGLFTDDETALRILSSLSQARVSPGLWFPVLLSFPAVAQVCALAINAVKKGQEKKRAVPLWFALWHILTLIPAFALSLWFARLNAVPVKVVVNFILKM